MFVAITLVACVIVYPLNWIRERHKLLHENNERYTWAHSRGTDTWDHGYILETFAPAKAPFFLRIFGEKPVEQVSFLFIVDEYPDEPTPEMQRAIRLFPEAVVTFKLVDQNGQYFLAKPED